LSIKSSTNSKATTRKINFRIAQSAGKLHCKDQSRFFETTRAFLNRPKKYVGRHVEFRAWPFDYIEKAGESPRVRTIPGELIMKYLVAIHHPDDYDPFVAEDKKMERDIDALNEEMIAAGVRVFAGGLHSASKAKSLRAQPDGKVLITDGPYLETKEHVGGFWLLEAADMDEALEWGRKAVIACRAPVEVRQFH
jgi:hypothetical protein